MKIAIIGTGGVGGYFGAKLVKAGYDVTFLARGNHLQAILNNGLTIRSILGDFSVQNFKVTDKICDIKNSDLLIIAVKAWQINEIRDDIKKILHQDSIILPLQNGVSAAAELSVRIDKHHVLGGMCRIISKIESPGVINHSGITPTIVIGELDKSISERLKNIQKLFYKAEIECKVTEDIEAELWKKLTAICVSGLLAVTKTTYGELRGLKETRLLMIELLTEIFELTQKIGINVELDLVDKAVSFIESFPYDSTSSLTRDVLEGKPSEIEYQNGTVVRLGKEYGVKTPVNSFVYYSILPNELKARGINLREYISQYAI